MRSKALGAHGSGRIRRASLYLAAFHGEGHAAVGTPPARSSSGGKKPDPASRNSGEVSGGLDEKSGWRKAQSVRRTVPLRSMVASGAFIWCHDDAASAIATGLAHRFRAYRAAMCYARRYPELAKRFCDRRSNVVDGVETNH